MASLGYSVKRAFLNLFGNGDGTNLLNWFADPEVTSVTATGAVSGATVTGTGAVSGAPVSSTSYLSSGTFANVGSYLTIGGAQAAAGAYYAQCYKVSGIADNTATTVASFSIPAGNQAAAFRVLLCATMNGSTDDFESTRVATGSGVINRQAAANAAATVSTIAQTAIATSGSGTITLAYSITTPTVGAGATDCNLQVTIVKTGTVTNHECVVFIELINSQASGITVGSP